MIGSEARFDIEEFFSFCESLGFHLSEFHKDMIKATRRSSKSAIMVPRGHSKTSLFSVAYPLYMMAKNPNFTVCGVSSALDQSWKTMDIITEKVETSATLAPFKVKGRGKQWSRFGITFTNGSKYYVKPFNSTIRGIHVDLFICVPEKTFIDTKDGLKRIKEIQVGDEVLTHMGRYRRVTRTFERKSSEYIYEITAGSNKLKITGNHPIMTIGGWKKASCLKVRDWLFYPRKGGEPITCALARFYGNDSIILGNYHAFPIKSIRKTRNASLLRNLEVEEDNSYIANGIIVHNCDDILRDDKQTQQQIKDLFWNTIFPCIQTKKGQIIVIGTPMTLDDLLHDLEDMSKTDKEWAFLKFQAVIFGEDNVWKESLWKENFSLDELKKIRDSMGSLMFSREYLCDPLSGGANLFSYELLQRQTRSVIVNEPRDGCRYFLGCDVALSIDTKADFTVLTLLEESKTGDHTEYSVIRMDRFKTENQSEMISKIKELYNKFHLSKVLIDQKGLGTGLVKMCEQDEILKHISEGFNANKEKKTGLISHLEGAMTKGVLFISDNSTLHKELSAFGIKKDRLGKETLEGLGAHDDTVISLALAFEAATSKRGTYSVELIF